MSDQNISKEFTWNNPPLGTLRACDVAEIRQLLDEGLSDADVALTLLRRGLAFRRILRTRQADGEAANYDITVFDPVSRPAAPGPIGPETALPKEIVDEILFLHAAGVNRTRLARLFELDPEVLKAILPCSMEMKARLADTAKPCGPSAPKPGPEVATATSTRSTPAERQSRRKSPFLLEESEIIASGGTYEPWD